MIINKSARQNDITLKKYTIGFSIQSVKCFSFTIPESRVENGYNTIKNSYKILLLRAVLNRKILYKQTLLTYTLKLNGVFSEVPSMSEHPPRPINNDPMFK